MFLLSVWFVDSVSFETMNVLRELICISLILVHKSDFFTFKIVVSLLLEGKYV